MTKADFIRLWSEISQKSLKETGDNLETFIQAVEKGLKKEGKIALVGFGNFELKKKAARESINPATGKKMKVPACKAPAFKVSKAWKANFNK